MKKIAFLTVALILAVHLFGQKKTAQADYKISAQLNPNNHTIKAYEQVTFKNFSNDTIKNLYFQLWANAFNKNSHFSKQLARFGYDELRFKNKKYGGGYDSLEFFCDSTKLTLKKVKHSCEIYTFRLPRPLLPGDSVTISVKFHLNIPYNGFQLGYTDSIFQLINWYPKLAAYDSSGWHYAEFSINNPLYSNFGNYSVKITVPAQYLVVATGDLKNKIEQKWINDLSLNGLKASDYPYFSQDTVKTLEFYAQNVNDFGFIASPKYYVLADSLNLSGRKLKTYVFFTDENILTWLRAISFTKKILEYTDNKIGPLPFSSISFAYGALKNHLTSTAANLIILSPLYTDSEKLEAAFCDGLAKAYFRNTLGINEINQPLLSRGLTAELVFNYIKINKLQLSPFQINNLNLSLFLNTTKYLGYNQKLTLNLKDYPPLNYYVNLGFKAAKNFGYLRSYINYLSKTYNSVSYDSVLRFFYAQNKYSSPNINDLESAFYKFYGKRQISWFFEKLIKKDRSIDYKISLNKKRLKVKSKRFTLAPMPVHLSQTHRDTLFWTPPAKKFKIPNNGFTKACLDPNFTTADLNFYNNFAQTGWHLRLPHFLIKLKAFESGSLAFTPAFYYRTVEGFMPGFVIHNFTFPLHKLNFGFMPVYSPKVKQPFGFFYLTAKLPGKGLMPDLSFNIYADRFLVYYPTTVPVGLFRNLRLQTSFNFHRLNHNDLYSKKLTLVFQRAFSPFYLSFYPTKPTIRLPQYRNFYIAEFQVVKNSLWRPFSLILHSEYLESSNILVKYLELKRTFHYTSLNNGLTLRLFAGENVLLSGFTTENNYRCQGSFLFKIPSYPDNVKNPFAHQFYYTQGGFAYYTPGYTYKKLATATLTTTLPYIPLVKAYISGAAAQVTDAPLTENPFLFYEYGLKLSVSFVKVFLPLGGSFKTYNEMITGNKWFYNIRFSINFESMPASIYKYFKF